LGLAVLAHLRTMLTDPGTVPIANETSSKRKSSERKPSTRGKPVLVDEGEETVNYSSSEVEEAVDEEANIERYVVRTRRSPFVGENWTHCYKCDSYRPPRAHHCRVCRRCVRKMDHHCPWVNNCVGEYNQKYFLQFLFYVTVLSLYSIVLVLCSWLNHDHGRMGGTNDVFGKYDRFYHLKLVHSICLGIESTLFGLFAVAVTCDQLQAIFNDETVIETFQRRGQRRRRTGKSRLSLLREVCGPSHWSLWVLPCSVLPLQRDLVRFAKADRPLNV